MATHACAPTHPTPSLPTGHRLCSGWQDWDHQAIRAWQSTRIEPVLRDGRAVEVYTEMEQALPVR